MTLALLAIREFVVDACLVNKEFPRNFLIFEENLTLRKVLFSRVTTRVYLRIF